MSYHLCIKLCTCLSVHRIEVKKHIVNTLCYSISREKKLIIFYKFYCAQKRNAKERRDKHVFICDDVLIKALWLDEESPGSRVFR